MVGVSNILDLPERFSHRVNSRIKSSMKRIVFPAYNHGQVKEILLNCLGELELSIFKP
jgi:Cdc6-like AAA superfamily ATPase